MDTEIKHWALTTRIQIFDWNNKVKQAESIVGYSRKGSEMGKTPISNVNHNWKEEVSDGRRKFGHKKYRRI